MNTFEALHTRKKGKMIYLSAYALRCGYVEQANHNGVATRISWHSCCYMVNVSAGNHTRIKYIRTLSAARDYAARCRAAGLELFNTHIS